MSEHKTVVIDLEEKEKTILGEHNELRSIQANGVLSVNNVSSKNRIWNVRVHLDDTRDGTDFAEEILNAGEIDGGARWESKYSIDVDSPILSVHEIYDTCNEIRAETAHWAYAHGKANPVGITITIKNLTGGILDNIIVNKTIPSELSYVEVANVEKGSAEFDEGTKQLVWKDLSLQSNEETSLFVTATGKVENSEMKDAGELVVTYRAEGQQRSSLNPDMTALTEFLTGIETAETRPNHWEVILECSNESELVVRLDRAEVYLIPEEGGEKQKMIAETPGVEMKPGDSWTSSFEVDSKTPPKCMQEVSYTPTRLVTKRVLGKIEKEPQSLPVYSIEYTKTFDPPEVNSFDKTPVEVIIEIKNTGTARINDVIIKDNLPDDVMPPKKEHVSITIAGREYTGEFGLAIDPDDQNPESPHRLTFEITGLKDSIRELEPGKSMIVNYAIMAWRNRPEKEYPSPIHVQANIHPKGHPTELISADDAHKIGVVYKKRRISVKKAINKGANPGEYVVMLVAENRGEVTVENVKITDWIPSAFEYLGVEPEEETPDLHEVADGTNITWLWTRMSPGDEKKLRVRVQGEGEYERREPEVTSD